MTKLTENQSQKIEIVRNLTQMFYQHEKHIDEQRKGKVQADKRIFELEASKTLILDQLSGLGFGWIPTNEDAQTGEIWNYLDHHHGRRWRIDGNGNRIDELSPHDTRLSPPGKNDNNK